MANYGAYIKLDNELNLSYHMFKAAEPLRKRDYPEVPIDIQMSHNIRRVRS